MLQVARLAPTLLQSSADLVGAFFRERYGAAAGLSDHSGTIYPGLTAAAMGLEVLEVHVVGAIVIAAAVARTTSGRSAHAGASSKNGSRVAGACDSRAPCPK